MGGDAAAALVPLHEARSRFQSLADAGNRSAAGMVSAAITETGDCLIRLGRLDNAASAYEEALERKAKLGDRRSVAVNKGQLGTVRMLQRRYGEALAAYEDARQTFEQLGEPRYVAISWHQIGMVHQDADQHDQAEKAFQASLRINVETADRPGEAATLNELGNLYNSMGRLEEAVRFYRQAATVYGELNDPAKEGVTCSNLAGTLIQLGRPDEARREILRAIECKAPFGHAAQPWMTFTVLADLERAAGNTAAANAARQRAIDAYLAYRRDGGENLSGGAQIFDLVAQAIAGNQIPAAESQVAQREARADLPAYLKALLPKLKAILRGARDPSLAADPDLDYDDAAELQLLLEHLARNQEA